MAIGAQANYPQTNDFLQGLQAAHICFAPEQQVNIENWADSFLQTAIDMIEQRTGYIPFLAQTEDSTEYYSPSVNVPDSITAAYGGQMQFGNPGETVLRFRGGYVSITSVTVGMTPDPTTGEMTGGTLLVPRLGYVLYPQDALVLKRPYDWLRFTCTQYGGVDSIQIVGKRGYQAALREDIWRGILAGALFQAEAEIKSNLNQGLLSFTEAGVTEKYREDSLARTFDSWSNQFEKAITRCKRREYGF